MEFGRARRIMVALEASDSGIYTLEWALNYLPPPPPPNSIISNHFVVLCVSSPQPGATNTTAIETEDMDSSHISGDLGAMDLIKEACKKYEVTYELKAAVGDAKLVICEAAKKLGMDLLVVGSHDYGGKKRFFSQSSVGDYCVRHAKCPVVVVKSRASST